MAAPPPFIQLSGGQGQVSAPPQQHHPGNFGGHQGHQGHNGQQAHQCQPMLQRQANPTHPPPPPMGQMPQGGNQVRGGMPPATSSHALPYGVTPPQNQMIRHPHRQGQLSHPSHLSPRPNTPQPDMPRRQKVEVFDIHSECLTEADARERLSSYVVICMTKADTSNEVDQDGYLLPPTWDRTTHSEQTDISQQEATRKVRELERTTLPVSDKKQDLPAALQRQFEHAQDRLERQEPDPRFHYVLAQFDSKIKKVEVPQLVEHMYHESHKKSKRGSRSRDGDRDRSKGKKKYKSKDYRIEPHRSKPKRRKERVSVTTYFKRTPKPEENCLRMLHDQNEYVARDHRMGAVQVQVQVQVQVRQVNINPLHISRITRTRLRFISSLTGMARGSITARANNLLTARANNSLTARANNSLTARVNNSLTVRVTSFLMAKATSCLPDRRMDSLLRDP
ncbi:hypothetical protein ACRE_090550 [Hapsidospora chrysogenum ATCC 11550]|uniref:Uncharacterized protein n=1 Tax=Hapsidospora chrysogenum (strain ATCC 11550 / CBS 779.69 / DSM 880 / IAM 14645 / JCM 23072 / IMI 49137) TaxID=857340 RepID=A0A086ST52_HAPC1|nr:hypothetical protein ACRE_090550 [Hapsidospora chrysogenum ATCC 11550]